MLDELEDSKTETGLLGCKDKIKGKSIISGGSYLVLIDNFKCGIGQVTL
jgi:hypothetical protein